MHIFRVRPQIPVLKDVQPLLEMDRDERKLDVFLTFHRSSLLVSDMKIFLPFTINLDPYIKKKIKEEQQSLEEDANMMYNTVPWAHMGDNWTQNKGAPTTKPVRLNRAAAYLQPTPLPGWPYQPPPFDMRWPQMLPVEPIPKPMSATTTLPVG